MTPIQMHAARAFLDLSRKECADIFGLSPETIKNIEHGVFTPSPQTLERIVAGFSDRGVRFFVQQFEAAKEPITQLQCVGVVPKEDHDQA